MTPTESRLILRAFGCRLYPPDPAETALCLDLAERGYLVAVRDAHQTKPAYQVARKGTEYVYRYMGYTR